MTIRPKVDMAEATRLTRQGRLKEAMAVLRGARPAAEDAATAHSPPYIEMVPPSATTGAGWTAPLPGQRPAAAPADDDIPPPPKPGGFLDRLRKLAPAVGALDYSRSPVAKPASLPEGARFEEHRFTNEAGSRSYKLYVPGCREGEALPLVVMLHGCTQSPDDFAAGTRMNALAEEQAFLVAYPEQAASANASKCWNWFNAEDQRRGHGEASLIAGITRQIMRDIPVEAGRVYVAGLSAGGAAAAIMGATYPDLYAAIGVHSGLACGAARDIPSAFAAMRQGGALAAGFSRASRSRVPTIVFHGDGDRTVNAVNGDQIIAQSQPAANLKTTVVRGRTPGGVSYIQTVQADDTERSALEQWVLCGVGHAWSGGSAAGSYTEPHGPDASREMVRFFLAHRLEP